MEETVLEIYITISIESSHMKYLFLEYYEKKIFVQISINWMNVSKPYCMYTVEKYTTGCN